ncbi:hypothetical protein ABZ369_34490, partial [Streptomyces sp. NPDC005918]
MSQPRPRTLRRSALAGAIAATLCLTAAQYGYAAAPSAQEAAPRTATTAPAPTAPNPLDVVDRRAKAPRPSRQTPASARPAHSRPAARRETMT